MEYKQESNGNSGVFIRSGLEKNPAFTGHEMQIVDDHGREPRKGSTGALYDVVAASKNMSKPAGEWNTSRVVAKGTHVEHWLNGQKVVEYEQGSPDWAKRVAASKFAVWPRYGKAMKGHIGLQEHGGRAEFRNIKIRELK